MPKKDTPKRKPSPTPERPAAVQRQPKVKLSAAQPPEPSPELLDLVRRIRERLDG